MHSNRVHLLVGHIMSVCLLYPTYDVDQSAASVYKHSIVLWLGKYHDIALRSFRTL